MDEIYLALQALGVPVAYDHFVEGESPAPPFICYLAPRSHNFFADDMVFEKIERIQVELYTDRKDPSLEAKVENALASFCWEKTEVYLDTENLYEILYEIEV